MRRDLKHLYHYLQKGLVVECLRSFRTMAFSRLGFVQLRCLFIGMSHDCNASCVHCYEQFEREKPGAELDAEDVRSVIDQFHALGGCRLFFCGGEFLMMADAADLIQYARSKRIIVSVTTNGIILSEGKIDELKAAGLNYLMVSIDSGDPATHDRLRGVKGCFDKAVRGMEIAKAKGLGVHIWTYVSKSNMNELEGVVRLGEQIGVEEIFVFFPLLSGHFFNKKEENLTFEEREAIRRQYNRRPIVTLEFPTEESVCVGGGREHINVMPSGDVTFCPPVPYSYGNIKERSLRDCLLDIIRDYDHFCTSRCTGQCIVNFPEYRTGCNAKFLYK